ncbi:very-long-chain (3R)-3-hydroxyacyl-CoA dehydratase 4 isoform X1 [Narcine bancroftii]|uniref:very-long-chain (3R)-3-hydroxyacyl-CoA dehydratase 4 isoform X1 n=1 Tax=Narcine bancroftii TaxID=1343680 RepID=UPI003831A27C
MAKSQPRPETRCGLKILYIFTYNLIQFCGHSWISSNIIARFLTFGEDSLVDTYYAIGAVMCYCQLLSNLELIHLLTGIEQSPCLPRFLQVTERNVILFVVLSSQEEMQNKHIVWAVFFLWNTLDVIRYPHNMLASIGSDFHILSWIYHSLWVPFYPSIVLAEVIAIYQSLPYFEFYGTFSFILPGPIGIRVHFPYVLQVYCLILVAGMYSICKQFSEERKKFTGKYRIKLHQN